MPLTIVRNDIVKMNVDAIVNSTSESLQPGGYGVDRSIHAAAGKGLAEELAMQGSCKVGHAVLTGSHDIENCRYIIHAVAPVYRDGKSGEKELLESCYDSVMKIAAGTGCRSVAIPLLAAGAYGYPAEEAYSLATSRIRAALEDNPELDVYLVLYHSALVRLAESADGYVKQYIDRNYCETKLAALKMEDYRTESIGSAHEFNRPAYYGASASANIRPQKSEKPTLTHSKKNKAERIRPDEEEMDDYLPALSAFASEAVSYEGYSFLSRIGTPADLDISFGQAVTQLVEERGLKPSTFYNKANISKSVYSNLKTRPDYVPSRSTALACVVALELPYQAACDMLRLAGITFSHCFMQDVIVEACIKDRIYDIDKVNAILFDNDQQMLGQNLS